MSRLDDLSTWLTHVLGQPAPTLVPASADASFRRYFRIALPDGATRIVMDAPPPQEDCRPFVHVAGLIRDAGLTAPEVLAQDLERGFLLLTDLGGATYLEHFATFDFAPAQADPYMREAITALVRWQGASREGVLPAYDEALLRRELGLFPEWFVARHLGHTLSDAEQAVLAKTNDLLVASALAQPQVYVHRDYMPRNLMVAPLGGNGPGILDFQDAVYGPITYDVASLFRDAFLSWEEEQVIDWTVRYWDEARRAGLPVSEAFNHDFGEFYRAFEWMGMQRHLKVLGIFCRLNYRDGKEKYLTDLPRFLGYARRVAERYIALKPFLRLLDTLENHQDKVGYTF